MATAVHSSLWCQTCLSFDELKTNVACIALAPPFVHVDVIADTLDKLPLVKENTHLFYSKNDMFPQMFHCIETKKPAEALLSTGKVNQKITIYLSLILQLYAGTIGAVVFKHLAELQVNSFQNKVLSYLSNIIPKTLCSIPVS